jgi:4-diphosphocytidyl-2C-methyl-D-erythritol kinase
MNVRAYAKINWSLAVLGQREDGYHVLDTLMQPISLYDELLIEPAEAFLFSCDDAAIPADDRNLVVKAAHRYAEQCGMGSIPLAVHLKKHIPSQAGLGGGSSDAAAMLHVMQEAFRGLTEEALGDLALGLGADVPFCMHKKAMRCGGIGEVMHPIVSKKYPLLLVQPSDGISTGALFQALQANRRTKNEMHVDAGKMKHALQTGDFANVRCQMQNDLLSAACAFVPSIGDTIERLYAQGAQFASMSGSGSCCFGVFRDEETGLQAKDAFLDMPFCQCAHTI